MIETHSGLLVSVSINNTRIKTRVLYKGNGMLLVGSMRAFEGGLSGFTATQGTQTAHAGLHVAGIDLERWRGVWSGRALAHGFSTDNPPVQLGISATDRERVLGTPVSISTC